MKTYRLIALVVAMLITVFLARFLADEEIAAPQNRAQVSAPAESP